MSETTVAATKLRILTGVELNLEAMAINVKWSDRFLVDGEIMSEKSHRGSYPVNEQMEVDDSVKTLLGKGLQDILGEAAVNAQRRVIDLETKNKTLDIAFNAVIEERDMLASNRQMLVDYVHQLEEKIKTIESGLAAESKE